jgi:hypothetical protein
MNLVIQGGGRRGIPVTLHLYGIIHAPPVNYLKYKDRQSVFHRTPVLSASNRRANMFKSLALDVIPWTYPVVILCEP